MDKKELMAANLEDAKVKAAAAFGVPVDQIKVTLIEEMKGLFGKPGKVKVLAEAIAPKKPAKSKVKIEAKEEPTAEPVTAASVATAEPIAEVIAKPVKAGRGAAKSDAKALVETADPSEDAPEKEEKPERAEVVATQEDADQLLAILNSLLKGADMIATATVTSIGGRYVNVELDGDDVGYLVGRRGEVLNSLQYLLNVISSRRVTQGVRVVLEGDNYRRRRETDLTEMATQVAAEVKKVGQEAVLDALPAFERRIIHQALVDYAGVTTYSEGEEPDRRVVISPDAH